MKMNYWCEEEEALLRKHYSSKDKYFIMQRIDRCWSGIQHKAHKMGLKRDKKFQYEGMIRNTLNNNPMNKESARLKCSISNTRNGIKKTRDKKRLLLLKDNGFQCEKCGLIKKPRKLVIHHKDGDRNNNKNDNFMILCFSCHSKLHNHGGLKISYEEITSIEKVGVEETFDLHTPIYNNFLLGNNVLSHNSGKSIVSMSIAVKWMSKVLVVDDICFTTEAILQRAKVIGKNHVLIRDEQTQGFGVGSDREEEERKSLEATTRKFGLNIIFCSPDSRDHSSAHYNLEIICINRQKRLTKVAIKGDDGNYIGYFVIEVLPESNKLWKAYNKRKDVFIKSVLARSTHRLSIGDMSVALKKHGDFRFAFTNEEKKIVATELFPNLTIMEISMVVSNLKILERKKEAGVKM